MSKYLGLALAAAATIAAAGGLRNPAAAQSVPPVPGIMPPIASHADPSLPVPTIPPEQIAPPSRPRFDMAARAQFRRLEAKAWTRFVPIVERRRAGSGGWASAAD
jgi:hypothetical protein